MHIKCNREKLAQTLKAIAPAVGSKVTSVLKHVLIEYQDCALYVEANDGELNVRAKVDGGVGDEGGALFRYDLLTEILSLSADEQLDLRCHPDENIIKFNNAEYNLPTTDKTLFTKHRFAEPTAGDGAVEINASVLAGLVDNVDFCEGRERYAGVSFSVLDKLTAVCSDGRSLAVARADKSSQKEVKDSVVPAKTFRLIGNVFGDAAVKVQINGPHMSVLNDRATVVSTLLASSFPQWRNIMPKEKPASVFACNCGHLTRALRVAISMLDGSTNYVEVEMLDGSMTITTKEDGKSGDLFSRNSIGGTLVGKSLKMLMRADQVVAALRSAVVDDEVSIQSWGAEKPWRLVSGQNEVLFAPSSRTAA